MSCPYKDLMRNAGQGKSCAVDGDPALLELKRIKHNLDQFNRLKRDEDVNPIHGIIAILADQVAALTLVVERLAK